jgi:hypothetical protein
MMWSMLTQKAEQDASQTGCTNVICFYFFNILWQKRSAKTAAGKKSPD